MQAAGPAVSRPRLSGPPTLATPLSDNPFRSRADVARAVGDLFAPLLPYFLPPGARVRLSAAAAHFDRAAAELEGFARPLWGIVPLAAGGGAFAHWQLYRDGLAAGTDPDHPDYWGAIAGIDQRQVELAALGFALRLARAELWDPLDDTAKQHVAAYLISGREHEFVDSNWKFFRVLIDLGLMHCGVAVDARKREAYLDGLERFALSNGWYRDGRTRSAEHYIPFAFHFYGLAYAALSGDTARAERYRARAAAFAQSIRHWYAPDGAALPFGRSLTYRFAHAGFWGALAFAGVEALPWGAIKGYYLRNLRWWAKQPIFDRDGVLSVGYAYPNLLMAEGYNSAGSPYWAMKAFLPLALHESHPFWAAEEEEAETFDAPVPLPEPGMVAQHLPGHIVALACGQQQGRWHALEEKYSKFAYSTRYAFSVESGDRYFPDAVCDGMLGFSDDGRHLRMREGNEAALIAGDRLYARWRPYADVVVETWLVPAGPWHIRLHQVTTPRRLSVVEGGFAIAKPDFRAWQESVAGSRAEVRTAEDISLIVGYDARTAVVSSPPPNTNLMVARTLLPQLRGTLEAGTTQFACAVLARPRAFGDDIALPPACPHVNELRRLFAAEGRVVPVFDLATI